MGIAVSFGHKAGHWTIGWWMYTMPSSCLLDAQAACFFFCGWEQNLFVIMVLWSNNA